MPRTVCPAAREVEGAAPGLGGCVCTIMEADAERADPILEGAPIGVFISERDDPSTFYRLCCGGEPPVTDLDAAIERARAEEVPIPASYTACPIWAAGQEITAFERAFKPEPRPEPVAPGPGVTLDEPQVATIEELTR